MMAERPRVRLGDSIADATIDVAVRKARAAAVTDPARTVSTTIAAMAAGAGAELVARQHRAKEALGIVVGRQRAARLARGKANG